MAIKSNTNGTHYKYAGTSSEEKPTPRPVGCKFIETDTLIEYKFTDDVTKWVPNPANIVHGRGVNDEGNYISMPLVIDQMGYLVPIDYLHNLVHEKIVYTISHTFLSVPNTESRVLMLRTGTKDLHFEINYNGDVKTRLKTYSAPTITGDGDALAPFNRVIGYGNGTNEFESYINSTYTGGTLRANEFIGSSARATRAGGATSGKYESILTPSQELIVLLTNAGGATGDIGITINCYERPPLDLT